MATKMGSVPVTQAFLLDVVDPMCALEAVREGQDTVPRRQVVEKALIAYMRDHYPELYSVWRSKKEA